MVKIINRNIEKEIILKEGIKPSEKKRLSKLRNYLDRESTAKSFKTFLQVKIKQTENLPKNEVYSREELIWILKELQGKYKEFSKTQREKVEIILEGWKGKDTIEIYKGFTNDFKLTEHRKDKETGEIKTSTHEVSNQDVNRILFWIKKWKIGESHKCYDFAEVLGVEDWETIWKKRTEIYFKLYYYPLKTLEKIGIIEYSGRGVITRIK